MDADEKLFVSSLVLPMISDSVLLATFNIQAEGLIVVPLLPVFKLVALGIDEVLNAFVFSAGSRMAHAAIRVAMDNLILSVSN